MHAPLSLICSHASVSAGLPRRSYGDQLHVTVNIHDTFPHITLQCG